MRFADRTTVRLPAALSMQDGAQSAVQKELDKLTVHFRKKAAALKRKAKAAASAPSSAKTPKKNRTRSAEAPFKLYSSPCVKARLNELFHGKCAYCETFYAVSAPVDVEHYRPKEGVKQDTSHSGYWWLGMDWENLLPSCIYCNRVNKQKTPKLSTRLIELVDQGTRFNMQREVNTGKGTSFPILGPRATSTARDCSAELPLLLNPTLDNPQEHLSFNIERTNLVALVMPKPQSDAGLLLSGGTGAILPEFQDEIDRALDEGLSLRGAVSISTFGLNRLGLVQARTQVLRHLVFLEDLVVRVSAQIEELQGRVGDPYEEQNRRIIKQLSSLCRRLGDEMKSMARPQAPYSAMVREYLEDFQARLSGAPAAVAPPP